MYVYLFVFFRYPVYVDIQVYLANCSNYSCFVRSTLHSEVDPEKSVSKLISETDTIKSKVTLAGKHANEKHAIQSSAN